MDSIQVRSSINAIYDRFLIPPNLRLHMYRAGSVAEIVCDNWKGAKPNCDDAIAACLLHDIGNIVKFDLDNPASVELLGMDAKNLSRLKIVKQEAMAKYGDTDYKATHSMLEELGIAERVIYIIDRMGDLLGGLEPGLEEDNELMICEYCDWRVSPKGIMTVEDRFKDFAYRARMSSSKELRGRGIFVIAHLQHALELERKLFAKTRTSPDRIDDKSIKPYLDKYLM